MAQESLRLRMMQSPIIPVVGELIRNHPGVISLGQGVVSYPPPRQAFDQIAEFLANPELHKYQAVYGVPQLLELIEAKLRDENGIDVKSAGQRRRVVVTAGGNMAFVNALLAVADEAYEYFTYGGAKHFSPGSIEGSGGHTISLYSLSKAYGFASWRIGWMVIPEPLFDAVNKIQDTILICPPVVSQFAAAGAMRVGAGYCRAQVERLASVREMVMGELAALGDYLIVPPADGAFYFFLKLDTEMKPLALVERMIKEHGVAAIPGDAFGMESGCYLRVAYGALRPETVAEGVGRLARGIREILGA